MDKVKSYRQYGRRPLGAAQVQCALAYFLAWVALGMADDQAEYDVMDAAMCNAYACLETYCPGTLKDTIIDLCED